MLWCFAYVWVISIGADFTKKLLWGRSIFNCSSPPPDSPGPLPPLAFPYFSFPLPITLPSRRSYPLNPVRGVRESSKLPQRVQPAACAFRAKNCRSNDICVEDVLCDLFMVFDIYMIIYNLLAVGAMNNVGRTILGRCLKDFWLAKSPLCTESAPVVTRSASGRATSILNQTEVCLVDI